MNIKRVVTSLIGMPIVTLLLILGNKYIVDIVFSIISIIAFKEFNKCANINSKLIFILEIICSLSLSFLHVVEINCIKNIAILSLPVILFILFLFVICTDMKINFTHISYAFIGIMYIIGFIVFLPLTYGISGAISGKILFWYILISAWGTDISAYFVGKKLGKHHFSKVSPKKTIEGCIGGLIGAVIIGIVFTLFFNLCLKCNINLLSSIIICAVLSLIGQVGDFAASTIKRNFNIKDFSNLFPGHGGMLDRIDSVMFIAPFAFFIFTYLL